jgi:hypothetical protein|tara:strand:- start:195 stop:779 length:585 start_codon:yes stop_codon:yes gene_type:complete
MIMVKEEKLSVYYLGLTFKEKKMKKLIMMLLMIGFGYSQSLPQPIIVGEELDYPTLKISQFVKVDESVGIRDDKVSLGIKQLVEESFQDTRYRLVEDDNADFTANVEVLYIGKPNEAFSIVGLFNRRNQKTQVNLVVNLVNNLEGEVRGYRGSGEIETNVTAAGLQIEDEAEFGKSELGGAVKKAILDAIQKID